MSKVYKISKENLAAIRNFTASIDADFEVFKSRAYAADVIEEQIFLGNKRYTWTDKLFMDYWQNEIADFRPNWLVLSILHEIGHLMTTTEKLENNREKLDKIYTFMYEQNAITEKEYFNAYFGIPAEKFATEWAIDFYRQNQILCNNLAKELGV